MKILSLKNFLRDKKIKITHQNIFLCILYSKFDKISSVFKNLANVSEQNFDYNNLS